MRFPRVKAEGQSFYHCVSRVVDRRFIFQTAGHGSGVYWCLDAPLVQIVGLYSNSAENPGFISGQVPRQKQKQWLVQTLKSLKANRDSGSRKALLFATHHPPYSSGGHSGSTEMLADIDDACKQADIMPDAFFSGHAHSIQRYTRSVVFGANKLNIPYAVTGCGGHGGQKVTQPTRTANLNPTYEFGYEGWGYTLVDITEQALTITSYGVDWDSVKKVHSVNLLCSRSIRLCTKPDHCPHTADNGSTSLMQPRRSILHYSSHSRSK
jgi:hypothetical protein